MRRIHLYLMILAGSLLLGACRPDQPASPVVSDPGLPLVSGATPTKNPAQLLAGVEVILDWPTPTPTHTRTMTPTSLPPSATGSPTRPRRPAISEEEAEFTPVPGLAVPAPVDPLPIPEPVDVLVLLGSDRTAPILGRTDTIILVFYQRQDGVTSLVSVPRDLLVYLPGKEMNRINTAYFFGGIDLLISTLEYNLGVRPHHWALAHLDDFSRFIDDLGGLDLSVSHPLLNDCGGIPTGDVHMDGAMALCYLRERKTSNDFIRSQRQLQALRAILDRLLTLDALSHLPEWHARYRDSVSTDLSLEDMLTLAPLVLKMGSATTHHYQISYDQVTPWRVPETGAQVMLPDRQAIRALLQEAISVLVPVEAGTTTPAPEQGTPGPDS